MRRLATRGALAVVPLVLLALPAPIARADSCVTPEGTLHSVPTAADGSLRAFVGDVTPFGPIIGGLTLHFSPDGHSFTGQFAFIAGGGFVFGTLEGFFTSPNTYLEALTITGGAGKYAGISGDAVITGALNEDGTAVDVLEAGEICLP